MQSGKLIALAYNSEAFQQEPETLKSYYMQRKRWAKGNYEVVLSNFKHLFGKGNWRVKLEVANYSCIFFWFNGAIVLSDLIFFANVLAIILHPFFPTIQIPFAFDASNIYIAQLMLFNWLLMIGLYLLQINVALASQFGQATSKQVWLAILSYFSYAQLFIIVSLDSLWSIIMDKVLHREEQHGVKTKRFCRIGVYMKIKYFKYFWFIVTLGLFVFLMFSVRIKPRQIFVIGFTNSGRDTS